MNLAVLLSPKSDGHKAKGKEVLVSLNYFNFTNYLKIGERQNQQVIVGDWIDVSAVDANLGLNKHAMN